MSLHREVPSYSNRTIGGGESISIFEQQEGETKKLWKSSGLSDGEKKGYLKWRCEKKSSLK